MDDPTEFDDPAVASEETDVDRLFSSIADGVVGAASGLVGVALMMVVLGGYVPEVTAGFLIFLAGGMVPWPLLFASLREYLPGESWPINGIFFGTALWTGFVGAFYSGVSGLALVLCLGLSLVAHWVSGASLGFVFSYLAERREALG